MSMHERNITSGTAVAPAVAAWYVVEGREGKSYDARLRLASAGLDVWMPLLLRRAPDRRGKGGKVLVEAGRKRKDVYVPRFGRYFFIRCIMSDSLFHAVSDTPNVAGMLIAPGCVLPTKVPDGYVDWLRSNGPEVAPQIEDGAFARGDTVRVVEGPFTSFEAKVEDVDKSGTIKLIIDIFGRPTPLVFEASQVVRTQQAKSRVLSEYATRKGGKVRRLA